MKYLAKTDTRASAESGFTIVELMIATVVFSMVLLVIIYGVLNFSKAYYGGVNSTATQTTTRNIVNTIAQSIEFSGNFILPTTAITAPPANAYYFCAGGNTYYYIQGPKYDGATPTQSDPGLFLQPGTCTNNPNFGIAGGKELLSTNMRITYLNVSQDPTNARLFTIQLGLAYGDGDLLCNASLGTGSTQGSCNKVAPAYPVSQSVIGAGTDPVDDVRCKPITGNQFCSHAALSTTVSLRVANSELAP